MAATLRSSQRKALDDDGYFVAPGVLTEEWIALLSRAFVDAPPQANGTQHVELGETTPGPSLAAWRALEHVPVVLEAAQHVLARPFAVRSLHGRNPLAGFGQQGLHADAPPWKPGDAPTVMTALWMIDPFTVENGATRVVAGSHKWPGQVPRAFAQPLARHPDERVVSGAAGSVLVFNGRLWHAGRRNESGAPRRAGQMVIVVR